MERRNDEGCTNPTQMGGVCSSHAATEKCSVEGCTNQAVAGGICRRHCARVGMRSAGPSGEQRAMIMASMASAGRAFCSGAARRFYRPDMKRCSHEGCTKVALTGGVCIHHGAGLNFGPASRGSSSVPLPSLTVKLTPAEFRLPPGCGDWEQFGRTLVGTNGVDGSGSGENAVDGTKGPVPLSQVFLVGLSTGAGDSDVRGFFRGLGDSSSVSRLILRECNIFDDVTMFLNLVRDLETCRAFELENCNLEPRGASLHEFLMGLHAIVFHQVNFVRVISVKHDDGVGYGTRAIKTPHEVITDQFLRRSLQKIILWRSDDGSGEPVALALLLTVSNDLLVLDLYGNCLDPVAMEIISETFAKAQPQCKAQSSQAPKPSNIDEENGKEELRTLDEIIAAKHQEQLMSDDDSLTDMVKTCTTAKMTSDTMPWRSLSAMLRSPSSCGLDYMIFSSRKRADISSDRNNPFIAGMKTLRFSSASVGGSVDTILNVITAKHCMLEDLDMSGQSFDDETTGRLINALMNNRSVKKLVLSGSLRNVTGATWTAVAALLKNRNSALEKLNLCYSPINNDALLLFASALADNTNMTELLLYNR